MARQRASEIFRSKCLRTCAAVFAVALIACPSGAAAFSIGETEFPLGKSGAFPASAACLASDGGCATSIGYLDSSGGFSTATKGLTSENILDVVPTDLFIGDVFAVTFATPAKNMEGPDIYLAQAKYLGNRLSDAKGINDFDIKLPGRGWTTIDRGQFKKDAILPAQKVLFTDPVPEPEVYQLHFAKIDLSDFGFGPGEAISSLQIRGPVRPSGTGKEGLDVVTVAIINRP